MLCAKFGRYYPISFLKFGLRSFAIWLLFPFEKGPGLHLNKLEGYFVLSLVEIGLVVLEKILKFQQYISSLFRYYLPLEKGMVLHLNKFESPSHNNALYKDWLKLAK